MLETRSYINEAILQHKLLSKEEELELIRRAQSKIKPERAKAAQDKLLLSNCLLYTSPSPRD